MGSLSICLLILIVSNMALSKPAVGQIASSNEMTATKDNYRVSRVEDRSPVYHAGIANVNGRFGKSIRAFTVNEFEKYIGALA